jgi:hypothetical protein
VPRAEVILMNIEEILALYDEQERVQSEHPLYRREVTPEIVRSIALRPGRHSFIMYSWLNETNADAVILRELDYYRSTGGAGLEWKLYEHDEPADLGKRLIAHGFVPDQQEGLLVLDLQELPEVYKRPVTGDGRYDIRRLITPEGIRQVVQVQAQVYDRDFSQLQRELEENLAMEPDGWIIYAAYVDGQPVCGSWISFPQNSGFAGLWGGATLKEYRQQGLYSQMVAIRAQEAITRGYRFLTVYAGDMSRPILLKRGFRPLTYTYLYLWQPEEMGCSCG